MTDGFSFSVQLTQRTIAYYQALGESITPETAQEYLRSMSSLYGSMMAFAEEGRGRAATALAAPSSPDLISPHSCKGS